MKFLSLFIALFSVQVMAAKKSSFMEVKPQDVIRLTAEDYNKGKTLEEAVNILNLNADTRDQILVQLKKDKMLKAATPKVKVDGRIVSTRKSKVDFSDIKKNFIKYNGKNIQITSQKTYVQILNEMQAIDKQASFSIFPQAFAVGDSDTYGLAMLAESVSDAQTHYETCLEYHRQYDAMGDTSKDPNVSHEEFQIQRTKFLNEKVREACYLSLPSSRLVKVFSSHDKVMKLECENGKPKSLETRLRSYQFLESTSGSTQIAYKQDGLLGCNTSFTCKDSWWKIQALSSSPAYCQSDVVETKDIEEKCLVDDGFKQIDEVYNATGKCCSEYPDNIVKDIGSDGVERTQNLCLAGLLMEAQAPNEAARRIKSKVYRGAKPYKGSR